MGMIDHVGDVALVLHIPVQFVTEVYTGNDVIEFCSMNMFNSIVKCSNCLDLKFYSKLLMF